MWPKSGTEGIFEVFLTLLEAQNLSKIPSNFYECIIFHKESKNEKFSSIGGPHQKRVPGGTTHLPKKPVFSLKKSKLPKTLPNFLKFGMSDLCQVLCWANEDSAKILSLYFSFLLLKVFLNLAFKLLILALQILFRAK